MLQRIAFLAAMAAFLSVCPPSWGEVRRMAVVARPDFPNNTITREELRSIYLGEIQILHGFRLSPIDQPHKQPIREAFLLQILQMTRDQYLDYWNKRLYQKGGLTPLLEDSSPKVLEAVQERAGALGYVWLEEVGQDRNIKVLLTIELQN